MNMEFGQSKHCCAEWIQDGAIFDVLHKKHGLCPDSGTYKNVCDSKAWDLLWTPCSRDVDDRHLFLFLEAKIHLSQEKRRMWKTLKKMNDSALGRE